MTSVTTTDAIRNALHRLGGQGPVKNRQLYEELDAQTPDERRSLRHRLADLKKRAEIIKTGDAWTYNYEKFPRSDDIQPRIWRFVRCEKPGWSVTQIGLMLKLSHTHTQLSSYCAYLEKEGFIEPCGKQGKVTLYRATAKADRSPETPRPPVPVADPFIAEKEAAARIISLMLCCNPEQKKTARLIVEACGVLTARFGGTTQSENGGKSNVRD